MDLSNKEEESGRSAASPSHTLKLRSLLMPKHIEKLKKEEVSTSDTTSAQSTDDKIPDPNSIPSCISEIDVSQPIKRTIMEAFIKVVACRRVTVETLSSNGEVINLDVQEVEGDPETFNISNQEKLSDDVSKFQVQKPDDFMLSHKFLGMNNFQTTISIKCPKFVREGEKNLSDVVFAPLNTNRTGAATNPNNDTSFSGKVTPIIQVVRADVRFDMRQEKSTVGQKTNKIPRKSNTAKSTEKIKNTTKQMTGTKRINVASEEDTFEIPAMRESKRVRKPSKKVVEMKEAELKERLMNRQKATEDSNATGDNEPQAAAKSEQKSTKQTTKQKFNIKKEPGLGETELHKNQNSNNMVDSNVIKNETADSDSQVTSKETVAKITSNTARIPELLDLFKDAEELENYPIEEIDDHPIEDFSIFDDDVYEKKYGREHKAIIRSHFCTYCHARFKNRPALQKHLRKHKGNVAKTENTTCKICQKKFSSDYLYQCHVMLHDNERKDGKYECKVCQKTYQARAGLLKHQRSSKECLAKRYVCDICHLVYSSQMSLDIHIRRHEITGSDEKEVCGECGKTFETRGGLNKHRKSKVCEISLPCEICGKIFHHKNMLEKHMNAHNRAPSDGHVCDVCGKVLGSQSALLAHKNGHFNIRNFVCTYCNKAFRQKGTMKSHERIHTGLRPYLCVTCGSSFRYSSHLIQHNYLHTGETPYPCTKCDRAFSSKQSLKKHLISHINKEKKCKKMGDTLAGIEIEENIDISKVESPSCEEIVFIKTLDNVIDENGDTQYVYMTDDGQEIHGYLANASDTIVATSDSQILYEEGVDGQNIIYQTVDGDNVTFVDEMQTSDLSILAETAQNYESPGVTYLIVKK